MASKLTSPLILFILLNFFHSQTIVGATEFSVGDDDGWTTGTNYLRWSQKYNFTVGDTLVFKYTKGQHNVYQVTEDTFRSCNSSSGVVNVYSSGDDRVLLANATKYWFICTLSFHCLDGMKFGITVANASDVGPTTVLGGAPPPDSSGGRGGGGRWGGAGLVVLVLLQNLL